jgi:hypothetical protein
MGVEKNWGRVRSIFFRHLGHGAFRKSKCLYETHMLFRETPIQLKVLLVFVALLVTLGRGLLVGHSSGTVYQTTVVQFYRQVPKHT